MAKIGDKIRYNIKDYLSDKEVDKLMDLFNKIKLDLSDDSFPTRTNRLEAVENMKKVLEIHNYVISEYDPDKGIWVEPSKSEREEGKKPYKVEPKLAEELSEDKHHGREDILMPFPDARDQHLINKNLNKATGGK